MNETSVELRVAPPK